jgi:catecholate siderophore receptor
VPEVLVEQQQETEPAPVVTPKPKPRPVARQQAKPPSPPQPSIEAYDADQKEIQSIIFDLPVDGDTLNRGTSGVDGYFATGTSGAFLEPGDPKLAARFAGTWPNAAGRSSGK